MKDVVAKIFEHYCEITNSDETAAILTLAEVIHRNKSPQLNPNDPESVIGYAEAELTGG